MAKRKKARTWTGWYGVVDRSGFLLVVGDSVEYVSNWLDEIGTRVVEVDVVDRGNYCGRPATPLPKTKRATP